MLDIVKCSTTKPLPEAKLDTDADTHLTAGTSRSPAGYCGAPIYRETVEMSKISPSEAIAHILPAHDLDLADRAIAELEECGYRIVEKDSTGAAPDLPTEVLPLDPDAAALRREMALT
jgi:hypothetical protein